MLALSMEMTNFQPNVSRICMSCPNLRPMFRCWWGWTQRVKAVRLHTRIDKNDMRYSPLERLFRWSIAVLLNLRAEKCSTFTLFTTTVASSGRAKSVLPYLTTFSTGFVSGLAGVPALCKRPATYAAQLRSSARKTSYQRGWPLGFSGA